MLSPKTRGEPPPCAAKGAYVRDGAISSHFAKEIFEAIQLGKAQPAHVSSAGVSTIDVSYRNSRTVLVEQAMVDRVTEMFESLRPDVERFFADRLGPCQNPVFLRYDPAYRSVALR